MHQGHRKRMYEKLKNGDRLYEHELLEILLFNAYPRVNTNPIAHALLNAFGNIAGVLNAEVSELCAVEGVGESVALYLKCIGECTRNIPKNSAGVAVLKSYEDFKSFVRIRLRGKTEEVLELYCIEKSGKVKNISTFTSKEQNKVRIYTEKVANVITANKPYALLIAHNHLSGNSEPSLNDDMFTNEVQLMCSMNNVQLFDHCIYSSDSNIFSYYTSGKIDRIKREYSFERLMGERYKKDSGNKSQF